MKSRIPQVQIGVLAAFVLIFVGLLIYQSLYIWPVQRCESHGDWWDEKDHVCAVPVPISMFTGRNVGGKLVVAPARPAAKTGK